jgi:hypothetical protein
MYEMIFAHIQVVFETKFDQKRRDMVGGNVNGFSKRNEVHTVTFDQSDIL